jgi:hypothetical protein
MSRIEGLIILKGKIKKSHKLREDKEQIECQLSLYIRIWKVFSERNDNSTIIFEGNLIIFNGKAQKSFKLRADKERIECQFKLARLCQNVKMLALTVNQMVNLVNPLQ